MNLSSLSPEQKTRLLAELDGFTVEKCGCGKCNRWVDSKHIKAIPSYLTSYDAIIPLIQHQPVAIMGKVLKQFKDGTRLLYATPEQLCDAVLIATGKAEL